MIISRTPLRISFVGGGSDIPKFYKNIPGAVVSTAINKYIYIAINKQFDDRIIISYSQTEIVTRISEIKHNLVREALKLTGVMGGIHITSISDIPAEGSGMGSSSSYLVGLLNALYAYQGKHVSAERLAQDACKIEIKILGKPIGKQDQYIAAYGGLQLIRFNQDGTVYVDPIICLSETKKKLEQQLMLFYTGFTRSADSILVKQNDNLNKNNSRRVQEQMVNLAHKIVRDLSQNKLESFGKVLHKNWSLKKKLAEGITTPSIDRWYNTAISAGAIGGKLLGAGGGGFLMFYAPTNSHKKIIRALAELAYQEVKFEPQGSKIIFVS